MALESPLHPSPSAIGPAFSPYADSPSSSAFTRSPQRSPMSAHSKDLLDPSQGDKADATSPVSVPSGEPSPGALSKTSTGTDIDSTAQDEDTAALPHRPKDESAQKKRDSVSIDTDVPPVIHTSPDDTPQSVILASEGFHHLHDSVSGKSGSRSGSDVQSPSQGSDVTVRSPNVTTSETQESTQLTRDSGNGTDPGGASPLSPPAISTSVGPGKFGVDTSTPQAQTLQEAEALDQGRSRKRRSKSLPDIPEAQDPEALDRRDEVEDDIYDSQSTTAVERSTADRETEALNMALAECWTLCNTLAGLSSIHRDRIFNFSGKGTQQEFAWKSCWRLCQKLYTSRYDTHESQIRSTLDLCRDFCQALFEVRQREDEAADSVLRVSFELNNHLYNTHDRNLPDAFRERTLDFYITLCHRLMKQRNSTDADETDTLLSACWSLAEMLFSLRQSRREGKQPDEELLGSAVQACWELCDLFREGWTQIRPDRGTPRPSQGQGATFSETFQQVKENVYPAAHKPPHVEPETPTTIFEDTALSPEDELTGSSTPAPPNILVLGTEGQRSTGPRFSSTESSLSGYSHGGGSSVHTSSTANTHTASTVTRAGTAAGDDVNLTRLKLLIIRVAMNAGFQQRQTDPSQPLHVFVKGMRANAFGSAPWQTTTLEKYRAMVLADPALRSISGSSLRSPTWASAIQIAQVVQWMASSGQYVFLRDLFRLVFGFEVEEARERDNLILEI